MKKQDFKVLKTKDLYPFPDNPFHVAEDETLSELAESIKEFGIVTPIITRPKEDGNGYEVIAGQRRVRASELAGINTVPAFVLPLDRDRAIITLVGPTFRAENSNTTRHAAEFWMIEPEIAFADLDDDMILAESMLKYIIRYVLENAPEEMNFFNSFIDKGLLDRLNNVANSEFARVTYTEAIDILTKNNDKFEYKVSWGCDLQTEHERYLTEQVYKRPVFVTDYPKDIKAFYMKLNDDGKTVAAVDCLVPGIGEIIGGSQREDDYDKLAARMDEMGLNKEDYGFYMDLRKYGSTRHAGFGLGFERCVMYLTGMGNIRDVIPFPRTVNNCDL